MRSRKGGLRIAALVATLGVAVLPSRALASGAELFGVSAEESALAGAQAARVHDFSAAHGNPAGLARVDGVEASFGFVYYGTHLTVNGAALPSAQPPDTLGLVVGAASRVPFGGFLRDRVFVGIALYILPQEIVRVISRPPDAPFFPYYDNRTQRLIVLPTLALRLFGGLSAGIAVNYLAGLGGNVESSEGATRAIEPRVDEAIFATARVNAGLLWRSSLARDRERWALALVYRQEFSVPFTTDTHNRVAGQPIDIAVDAQGLYTPHELVLGAAGRPASWLQLSADVTWGLWSRWRGPYVAVTSTLPLVGSLDAPVPHLDYRDTVSVRVGAEATRALPRRLTLGLRAGYGVESSPIPAEQPGVTNLLDGVKHFIAIGAGLVLPAGAARVRIDLHGQVHVLQPRTLRKQLGAPGGDPAKTLVDEAAGDGSPGAVHSQNPGWPSITGGGFVWATGLTLTVAR